MEEVYAKEKAELLEKHNEEQNKLKEEIDDIETRLSKKTLAYKAVKDLKMGAEQ